MLEKHNVEKIDLEETEQGNSNTLYKYRAVQRGQPEAKRAIFTKESFHASVCK